jgi:hypothetical protein
MRATPAPANRATPVRSHSLRPKRRLPGKLSLGRTHAYTIVTAHVAEHTFTVDFPDGAQRTFSRASTQPVRRFKAHRPHTLTINPRPEHEIPGVARAAQSAGRPL